MDSDKLKEILRLHKMWANSEDGGVKANLSDANLRWANLRGADLRGADLRGANLSDANLRWANLRDADLRGANLRGADLRGADLRGANLRGADNIPSLISAQLMACPESGPFVGWKKCYNNAIVELLIPDAARRSSATTRKCRADHVYVLNVFGADEGISQHNNTVKYRKGEYVHCDKWDEDRWTECGGGIHFFITRAEAEAY
jgi:hypothetical protein